MKRTIVERTLHVFIGFLLLFFSHFAVARAELPIAVTPEQWTEKSPLDITLPDGAKVCTEATATATATAIVKLRVADRREGKEVLLTEDGNCENASKEKIYIAAVSVTPSDAYVRVDANSATLIFSTDKALPTDLPPTLANVWLGGTKIDGLKCSGKNCEVPLPSDSGLINSLPNGVNEVTVAHDSATGVLKSDGTLSQPTGIPLGWRLPNSVATHEVNLNRIKGDGDTSSKLQTEFNLDVPYGFLFEEGPFTCKFGNVTKNCGELRATPDGPVVTISNVEAKKYLEDSNGSKKITLEFASKATYRAKSDTDTTGTKEFTITVGSTPCSFQVTQLTPVSRGVKGAQVLLEISSANSCAMSSWKVESPRATAGVIVGSLRRFDDFASNLYLIEVDTTAGDRDDTLPLVFTYSDGTEVDTAGPVEIRVDGRVSLSAPLILVNTNVEDELEGENFSEFEITDTIAQSRRSLVQFRQLTDPSQWWLRLPAGVQAAACYPDGAPQANLVEYRKVDAKDKQNWSGFCVDVERNSARTIDFAMERRAKLGDLLDPDDPNRSEFVALFERTVYLGAALETIQVKQAPFSVKTNLLSRVRLVCQGDVGAPATVTIRAFRHPVLEQCNLYFELEDGALDKLTASLPRHNWKGKALGERAKKKATADARTKRATATTKRATATTKRAATTTTTAATDAETKATDAEKDATDAETKATDAEAALAINACDESGLRADKDEISRNFREFSAKYGQQKLQVKLWELGAEGEYQEVSGSENVIKIKWDRADSGAYPLEVRDGVLAMCVDLTHQGKAARRAYDVVKITVEHDDTFYEVAWQDDQSVEFSAKVRRMPALAINFGATAAVGPRFFFSLAIPTMIRVPSTGRESETSSGFRLANAVSFQAGVVAGTELWNFNENHPLSPVFNPQIFVGVLLLGLPTEGKPSPIMPSFIYGVGFRLPSGDDASKAVEASTSLLLWGERSLSARREVVNSFLFGFNVSIGFFGS